MRWLLSFLLLGLLSVVQAVSSSGNKLLVVLEELADKSKYSKYLADLEGMDSYHSAWFMVPGADFLELKAEATVLQLNRQRAIMLRSSNWARELMTIC